MKRLLLGLLALSLAACDDAGGSAGPSEPCTSTGCPEGEVCKNLGLNEATQRSDYECVVPRPMGATCDEDFQCEETCSKTGRMVDDPAICTQGCSRADECPAGFYCDTDDLRRCLPDSVVNGSR